MSRNNSCLYHRDTSDDLKVLLPKLKGYLEQFIKDKKNVVNTYYAATVKQFELIANQISPDMLNVYDDVYCRMLVHT